MRTPQRAVHIHWQEHTQVSDRPEWSSDGTVTITCSGGNNWFETAEPSGGYFPIEDGERAPFPWLCLASGSTGGPGGEDNMAGTSLLLSAPWIPPSHTNTRTAPQDSNKK